MSAKYLIHCRDGFNNIERATIPFILAVSASKEAEVAVFASADAADVCVRGAADGAEAPGYEPLGTLMSAFIENGGKIWLCPACAKAKGISGDDLAEGVEIAGAPRAMEYLESGAKVLA